MDDEGRTRAREGARAAWLPVLGGALVALGCSAPSTGSSPFPGAAGAGAAGVSAERQAQCRDATVGFEALLEGVRASPGACASDADCKLVDPTLRCADGSFFLEYPPLVTSPARESRFDADLLALKGHACSLDCGMGGIADGPTPIPKCVAGTCASTR